MKEDLKNYLQNYLTNEWQTRIQDPEFKSRHNHAKKKTKSTVNDLEEHKDM
jgi:hypothetical protein